MNSSCFLLLGVEAGWTRHHQRQSLIWSPFPAVQRRLAGVSCIGAEIGSFSWPIRNLRRKPRAPLIEGAGKVSGDKEMQREGKADKAKGDVHKAAGDVKDAARNVADNMKK